MALVGLDSPSVYTSLPHPEWVPSARIADPQPALGLPAARQQVLRLGLHFNQLATHYRQIRDLRMDAPSSTVLVFETAGAVEELRTLTDTEPDLEWLGEWPTEFPSSDAFFITDAPDAPVPGQQYQLLFSPKGLYALLARWERYRTGKPDRTDRRWTALFDRLHNLWPWTAQHRYGESGFWAHWEERLKANEPVFNFEVELWYRPSQVYRELAVQEVQRLVAEWGGTVLDAFDLAPIAYHGLMVAVPSPVLRKLEQAPAAGLLQCPFVKFLRPTGTLWATTPKDTVPTDVPTTLKPGKMALNGTPAAVCLLDGLPHPTHPLLAGRLRYTDAPNETEAPPTHYPLAHRHHATQMASLVLHGDLNSHAAPLASPLEIAPILETATNDWHHPNIREQTAQHELPVRSVWKAVLAVLANTTPARPAPRVFLLGVNDQATVFADQMSPLARLLDWFSHRYGLLFIVPAGNYDRPFSLNLRHEELYALQGAPSQLQRATLERLFRNAHDRRILAPAEAVNVLTVGASHQDASPLALPDMRFDLLQQAALGSPLSRQGPGYLNAIKPDLLFPGGRQLYTDQFFLPTEHALLAAAPATQGRIRPPGLKTASPAEDGGGGHTYTCGSDKAAALAARLAARIQTANGETPQPGVLVKALLAHGARKNTEANWLRKHLEEDDTDRDAFREWIDAYLGLGTVDPEVLPGLAPGQQTWTYTGELRPDQAAVFRLPLPLELARQAVRRQVTATLAWHSPIEPRGGPYRLARLWLEVPTRNDLNLKPLNPDRKPLRRGTLWHEVFESAGAIRRTEPPVLTLQVNCRASHRTLPITGNIPFALVVTVGVD